MIVRGRSLDGDGRGFKDGVVRGRALNGGDGPTSVVNPLSPIVHSFVDDTLFHSNNRNSYLRNVRELTTFQVSAYKCDALRAFDILYAD